MIVWQDNVVDKNGAGIGGAMLGTELRRRAHLRANRDRHWQSDQSPVQLLADNNMFRLAEQRGRHARHLRPAGQGRGRRPRTPTPYGTNFFTIDLRVNTYTKDQQVDPAVAALPDGSAIITWSSYGQDGSMWGVYARKITGKGALTPAREFKINQYTQYNQRKPAVAALANGQFVVVWVSEQERFYNSVDVYARVFTAVRRAGHG